MTNEEAARIIKEIVAETIMFGGIDESSSDIQAVKLSIKALENARPTGEWYYSCQNGWHCSICQQIVKDMPTVMGKVNFDYCPNCGAKMRKEA